MKFLIFFVVGSLLASAAYFLLYKNTSTTTRPKLTSTQRALEEHVGSALFTEMTIPNLRSRSYESQIGELKQYQKKTSYNSYLTDYISDGLHINALLTQPTGTPPPGGWPAIVFIHGYIPPTLYKTTERYIDYIDYLARSGFVVFKIDLRGHGDSEGSPGGAYYSSDYIIDTLSAREALKRLSSVNPDRIGLWGHSMAGNVVMRSFAVQPDIKAVAIWAGAGYTYTDLQQYRIHDNSYRPPAVAASQSGRQRAIFEKYGQFSPTDAFWKTVAPTNYLGDLKGALALFHAKDDTVVSIEYSRNLNALLDKTTVPHELHEYPTGGHNITSPSFSKAMQDTVSFYKKYL